MSFQKFKAVISEGDTVILYININSMYAIEVESFKKNKNNELIENVFQTTYGALKVMSLVGKKYGTKVQLSRGWAFVLHPTPELWTLTLPHRTQIIYSLDISVIIHQLELRPGKIVIESGTGSGSLSHALVRSIQPDGFLYTFDFHGSRVAVAEEEFRKHDINDFVRIRQRDVCLSGFGDELKVRVDAVFLDLPHPWEALRHVPTVFKKCGGRFSSFSPCIEQVQKTCETLRDLGFVEIRTMECLQKEYQVQTRVFPVLDLEDRAVAVRHENPRWQERRLECLRAYFSPRRGREFRGSGTVKGTRFRCNVTPDRFLGHKEGGMIYVLTCESAKRREIPERLSKSAIRPRYHSRLSRECNEKIKKLEAIKTLSGIPPMTTPGHTGYLTFATFPPAWARADKEPADASTS